MSMRPVDDTAAHELARLIKRAVQAGGRGWCSTHPLAISRYLIAQGVTVPDDDGREAG